MAGMPTRGGVIYDDTYWIFPTWSDDLTALVPFDDGEIYQEVTYFRFTFRPFKRVGKILQQDAEIATGAGHHSVMNIPAQMNITLSITAKPYGETARDFRVTCIDRMEFDNEGHIKPVKMTREGVEARPISR